MIKSFWRVGALLAIILTTSATALAVGSGGILNLVPQAQVWEKDAEDTTFRQIDCKVYVHPMEGSLVLIKANEPLVLALDKNKHHAITMKRDDIKILSDGLMIDVPEHIPYVVLPLAPDFNRTYASHARRDGSIIKVVVQR
jgi:hypothetical protein